MFRYFLIISLSAFASYHSVVGQKNQSQATIISYENDTINGFINPNDFKTNPKTIRLRNSKNEDYIILTAIEVKELIVDDDYYFGTIVQVESSPHNIRKLSDSPNLTYRKDTVFIQKLVDGDKSLFSYKDVSAKIHFFIMQSDSLVSLITKTYRTGEAGSDYVENKLFVGQLKIYFQEFPELFKKIETTKYSTSSLLSLFQSYYQLVEAQPKYFKNNEAFKIRIGIIAGPTFTKLETSGSTFPYVAEANYPISSDFCGGFALDLIMPRNNDRLSFNTELIYTKYQTASTYSTFENDSYYSIIETELGFSYLKLNIMPRYRFYVDNNTFFINSGISVGFVIASVNKRFEYNKFYDEELTEEGKALEHTQSVHLGYFGGLGFNRKKISTELRYEYGGRITNYFGLSTSTNNIYLLIGYLF